MNLGHFLTQTAQRLGGHDALIRGPDSISFRELNRRVDSACHALTALGVQKGDRVLVQSRNSFAMFETMFATFKLGNYSLILKRVVILLLSICDWQ